MKKVLLTTLFLLIVKTSFAQLEATTVAGGDAYARGKLVEIGINDQGVFGANTGSAPATFHDNRETGLFGFIANPLDDGWVDYDGDFFTPGSPEEGFCLEIDGTNYCNNNTGSSNEIPGSITSAGVVTDPCFADYAQISWSGNVGGLAINRTYSLTENGLFIQMITSITNTTGAVVPNVYWMHNIDPDNNQTINGSFTTDQEIISQASSPTDNIAIVTASQNSMGGTDADGSSVSFYAQNELARVSFGGFDNDDASDVWDGIGGFTGTEGATNTDDEAMSIAFNLGDIAPGETKNFQYFYFTEIIDTSIIPGVVSITGVNPTSCGGTDGSLIYSGLTDGETYTITYDDDGVTVGPNDYVADATGLIILTGLDAGTYDNFTVSFTGCVSTSTTMVDLVDPGAPIFTVAFTDPTTCDGTEGTITISGLAADTNHEVTYTDDGVVVGPATLMSNAAGEIIITGLNEGSYTAITVELADCPTVDPGVFTLTGPVTPISTVNPDQVYCDDDHDAIIDIDLTAYDATVIGGLTPVADFNVTYYLTESEAIAGDPATEIGPTYTTPAGLTAGTVWVRLTHATSLCYSVTSFDYIINLPPLATDMPEYSLCSDTPGFAEFDLSTMDVIAMAGQTGVSVSYHETEDNATNDVLPVGPLFTNTVADTQVIYIRLEYDATNCFIVFPLTLVVPPNPTIVTPSTYYLCDVITVGDYIEEFDLSTKIPEILGGATTYTIKFYPTALDAENETAELPNLYSNTIPAMETIYVRANDVDTGCRTVVPLVLEVVDIPVSLPMTDIPYCDDDNDGFGVFDLESATATITGGDGALTVTYHETFEQAENAIGALSSPYANIDPYNQIIYIRVYNATTRCENISETLNLFVVDSPIVPSEDVIFNLCDYDGTADGVTTFDLTDIEPELLAGVVGLATDYTVDYYLTEADAIAEVDAISTPTAFENTSIPDQVIYAVVTSTIDGVGCTTIKEITLHVDLPPVAISQPFSECDDDHWEDMDETATFDLLGYVDAITGGDTGVTIDFYEVEADAIAGAGASLITTPEAYDNIIPAVQNIYARVFDPSTGCFTVAIITLRVEPNPTPSKPEDLEVMEVCDGDVDGDGLLEEQKAIFDLTIWEAMILQGDGPHPEPGVSLTYFENEDNALANVDAIATPDAYENATNPQIIYIRATNDITDCTTLTWYEIFVPVPQVYITGEELLCVDGDGVPLAGVPVPVLTANVGPGIVADYTYEWQLDGVVIPGETADTLVINQAGEYTVTISSNSNTACINYDSFTVTASSGPIEFDADVTTLAFDESHQIIATATGIGNYEFSLDGADFVSSGTFDNVIPGLHTVTIQDEAGCGTVTIPVLVVDYMRFFTPNGDGFNDVWQIKGIDAIPISQIYIFDRFGKLLKQLDTESNTGWDGTYNGQLMPATDYWFKIIYIEGDSAPAEKEFKAHFSLKR